MKKALAFVSVVLLSCQLVLAQQALPITRVLLYKNGMAYIVRSGQLTAPVSLTFHPDEMNDVLKSFTAWNPDNNNLYSVGYTTGIPAAHMLGRFPFDMSDDAKGLGGFLSQVKGAEVRLILDGRTLEGKLVAVQQSERVVTQQTTASDYHLTILLANGTLQTVWLGDVRTVEFVDPALRSQLGAYLDVLAEGRQDVTREVSVYPVPAPGPVQVAYLQQFPLWKTSYRVDLADREGRIQGWAQIDNPTGESWNNVEVSLLSGAPVSFVMNLYEPLYTSRSTVPVPGTQVAAPRQYESAVRSEESSIRDQINIQVDGFSAARTGAGGGRGAAVLGGIAGGPGAGAPPPPAPAFPQAQATEVQDFFEYRFPFPVQLASRQSALLPFLQKPLNIERLSIFNPRTDRGNAQLGARVENNTDTPFEAGPVTFFESGRYAGEAVLAYLPRSEKRLISYGIDHDIQIATKQQSQPETSTRLTVSRGVAVLYMESVATTTYEVRNKGTQKKSLIVEHPRIAGRELRNVKPTETTDNFYRFNVALAPGQETNLAVPEIVARQTSISLQSLNRNQLTLFAGNQTPQAIRAKLGEIVTLKEQIGALESELQTSRTKIDTLFRDQERLRENIKALGDSREEQDLRKRYLDQLTRQEDEIDATRVRVDAISKQITTAQNQLSDMISTLSWGE